MNTPTEQPKDLRADMSGILKAYYKQPKYFPDDQVDQILRLCEAAALAALPEKRDLIEPVTKRPVTEVGDKVGIDLDTDQKGSLVFIQDNGFNQAIATAQANIHRVFGGTTNE